jgi:hypothetical protein
MSKKTTRRALLVKGGYGLGGLALASVLPGGGLMSAFAADATDPMSPKPTAFSGESQVCDLAAPWTALPARSICTTTSLI